MSLTINSLLINLALHTIKKSINYINFYKKLKNKKMKKILLTKKECDYI